jgi:hypothetical protein
LNVYKTSGGSDFNWLSAQILVHSDASYGSNSSVGTSGHVQLGNSAWMYAGRTITHELGHYEFTLGDEYTVYRCSNDLSRACSAGCPGGSCVNANTVASLARSCQNSAHGMCVMEYNTEEYCTPDVHTPNNDQQDRNHESCWETIKRKNSWVQMPAHVQDLTVGPCRSGAVTGCLGGLVQWIVH